MYSLLLHFLNQQAKKTGSAIFEKLAIQEDDVLADIGCGGGYFSYEFARRAPRGQVFAIDVDQRQLDFVARHASEKGLENILPIRVNPNDSCLPLEQGSVDIMFLRDVFHDVKYLPNYFQQLRKQLSQNGRMAIVEFTPNKRFIEGRTGHCTDEAVIRQIMTQAGFELQESFDFLQPRQSFTVWGK